MNYYFHMQGTKQRQEKVESAEAKVCSVGLATIIMKDNDCHQHAETHEALLTLFQVSHVIEEARSAADSLQKSVAKAFHGGPKQEFSMGMSAGPRPAPIPGYVRLMQSGALHFLRTSRDLSVVSVLYLVCRWTYEP